MNELIKLSSARINDETVQTCSARDLHRFLGIGKDFSTWVKAQIERAAFAENVDYVKISGKSLSPQKANASRAREAFSTWLNPICSAGIVGDMNAVSSP